MPISNYLYKLERSFEEARQGKVVRKTMEKLEGDDQMTYVLFNPKATHAVSEDYVRIAANKGDDAVYISILDITDMKGFFDTLKADDEVLLMGGDGTLGFFAGNLAGYEIHNHMEFIPAGSGNDFYNDVKTLSDLPGVDNKDDLHDGRVDLNAYVKDLPYVEYGTVRRTFVNGAGCGIDGEACYVGMKEHQRTGKPANYSLIAFRLALFGYRKNHAVITVDGKTVEFDDVWMVTTSNGRYFGGGVKIAPAQNRLNKDRTVTVVCLHKKSRLGTLARFRSLFTGDHVKRTDWCYVAEGKDVHVTFRYPCTLQIDGDTVPEVSEYAVKTATGDLSILKQLTKC